MKFTFIIILILYITFSLLNAWKELNIQEDKLHILIIFRNPQRIDRSYLTIVDKNVKTIFRILYV